MILRIELHLCKNEILRYLICFFISLFIFSCQSKDGDYTLFTPEQDVQLGQRVVESIKADPLSFPLLDKNKYPEAYRHLYRIRDEILSSDRLFYKDEFSWDIGIIHNDTIKNAFCTPGGFIFVYTGLIKFLETEDELAGVLGHEMAHADLRHSTDQMTRQYGIKLLVMLITGGEAAELTNIGLGLLGLKFSRNHEREADEQSVIYLNDTGYDPKGFATFFQKLSDAGETAGALQFLNTHPNPENRVKLIEDKWRELGSKKKKDSSGTFARLKRALP